MHHPSSHRTPRAQDDAKLAAAVVAGLLGLTSLWLHCSYASPLPGGAAGVAPPPPPPALCVASSQ